MQDLPDLTPEDLRKAIGLTGLSQAKFADAIGVTTAAVEHWLSGRRSAPPMARLAIAALLAGLEPWKA